MTSISHSDLNDPALGLPERWYIACLEAHLAAGPVSVRVAGRTIVVQRDPHGRVLADPADWPLVVADHYVWVYTGTAPNPARPPVLPVQPAAGRRLTQRTVRIAADYRLVLENSLDFAHSAVAHRFTQPNWWLSRIPGLPPLRMTYRPTEEGLEVVARWGRCTVFIHRFALPDRLQLVVLPETPLATEVVVHHVPESRRHCRMEILLAAPGWRRTGRPPEFLPGELLLHRQDKAIVEAQQKALDDYGPLQEFHCAADAYTLLLRRILAQAHAGAWPPERLDGPKDVDLHW